MIYKYFHVGIVEIPSRILGGTPARNAECIHVAPSESVSSVSWGKHFPPEGINGRSLSKITGENAVEIKV